MGSRDAAINAECTLTQSGSTIEGRCVQEYAKSYVTRTFTGSVSGKTLTFSWYGKSKPKVSGLKVGNYGGKGKMTVSGDCQSLTGKWTGDVWKKPKDVWMYRKAVSATEAALSSKDQKERVSPTPSSSGATIAGKWQLNANNYKGKLEFTGAPGNLSARIYYDVAKRWETLADVHFDGSTGELSFRRPWSGNPQFQKYRGTMSGNSISGTFTDNNSPGKTWVNRNWCDQFS